MRNQFSTTKHFIKVLCCFFYLLIYKLSFCQTNLVPNPSFEQYTNCPINFGSNQNIKAASADIWYKPDIKGANYYTKCTNNQPYDGIPYNFLGGGINYQIPKTGVAYFVLFYYNQNVNNYIQVKLLDSLKVGKKYYGEYYVSLVNTYLKGCDNIAMLFTKQAIYADTTNYPNLLQANPQIVSYGNPIVTDTMGWVKISGIFTAQGGEQYLTLGNFKLESQTQTIQIQPFPGYYGAAYYVDDVAVYNLDSFCLKADAGRDTTIAVGDSVFIGSYTNGIDTIKWYNASGQVIDSTRPGFWVKPTTTGTSFFVLQQTVNGCYSSDTVYINAVLPLNFINYNVISTKEKSVENNWQTANEINVSHYNIERSTNAKDFTVIGKVKADNKQQNKYTFTDDKLPLTIDQLTIYYRIAGVDNDGKLTYSQVKKLSTLNSQPSTINIYPNPAKDVVHIESKEAIQQLLIIDYLGRTVKQLKVNSEQLIVDIKDLPKGVYLLHITNKLNNVYNEKLIVE